jgi:hypothetical protein
LATCQNLQSKFGDFKKKLKSPNMVILGHFQKELFVRFTTPFFGLPSGKKITTYKTLIENLQI